MGRCNGHQHSLKNAWDFVQFWTSQDDTPGRAGKRRLLGTSHSISVTAAASGVPQCKFRNYCLTAFSAIGISTTPSSFPPQLMKSLARRGHQSSIWVFNDFPLTGNYLCLSPGQQTIWSITCSPILNCSCNCCHPCECSLSFPLTQIQCTVSYGKAGFHLCVFEICAIFQEHNIPVNWELPIMAGTEKF